LDDIKRKQIIELRIAGAGYKAIANEVNLSRDTIRDFCKRKHLNGPIGVARLNYKFEKCKFCGKGFKKSNQGRPRRFCSDNCRRTWWSENKDKKNKGDKATYKITCRYCNKEFKSYGNKKRKYCSKYCFVKSRFYEEDSVNEYSKNEHS
jgi:hypothetical protein